MENEEEKIREWTRYQIMLPQDEVDPDDEYDLFLEKADRMKRNHVTRGKGLRGV